MYERQNNDLLWQNNCTTFHRSFFPGFLFGGTVPLLKTTTTRPERRSPSRSSTSYTKACPSVVSTILVCVTLVSAVLASWLTTLPGTTAAAITAGSGTIYKAKK